MEKVPNSLTHHIRDFADKLREKHTTCQDATIINYRSFLRGNIIGVIEKTFPIFNNQLGKKRVCHLVDEFLATHGAEEAEFHHIATEFLIFLRAGKNLETENLQLVEYEWVLFCVEIDPADVSTMSATEIYSTTSHRAYCNPTLKCIRLNSAITKDELTEDKKQECHSYGIFRNKENEVMKKKLTPFDHSMLYLIIERNITNLSELEKQLPAQHRTRLAEWIDYNQKINFISLQRR
ncbi:HvfC/BufC family peptide modification chaperone [Pseudomonas cerasi]